MSFIYCLVIDNRVYTRRQEVGKQKNKRTKFSYCGTEASQHLGPDLWIACKGIKSDAQS